MVTSRKTTFFREESREIIRNYTRATEYHSVIFTGNGVTSAINLLAHSVFEKFRNKPIILLYSYAEHHSNLLPWFHENLLEKFCIPEDENGKIDDQYLKIILGELQAFTVICSFSACSNLTGVVQKVEEIDLLVKSYENTLLFWDYATAGQYLKPDLSRKSSADAIFLSPHKIFGGVQSSGVLIVKKELVSEKPFNSGGGSVFFVRKENEIFHKNEEIRSEAGTPNAIGDIRAGLVFKFLRDHVGEIQSHEESLYKSCYEKLQKIDNLVVLGLKTENNLPIFSFLIRHGKFYLHHNLVSTVLNDFFGIQARSGCMCAGPYAQKLLGIESIAQKFEENLIENPQLDRTHLRRKHEGNYNETFRPGFTRITFSITNTRDDVEFVMNCLEMVSIHGYKLLAKYRLNPESGEWRHMSYKEELDREWLSNFSAEDFSMKPVEKMSRSDLFTRSKNYLENLKVQVCSVQKIENELNWFLQPADLGQPVSDSFENPIKPRNLVVKSEVSLEKIERVCILKKNKAHLKNDKITNPVSAAVETPCENGSCLLPAKRRKTSSITKPVLSTKWHNPDKKSLFKPMAKAIEDFSMIKTGDRILVGISGGKDSLTLIHALKQFQQASKKSGPQFDLACVTVDPQTEAYDPSPLKNYFTSLDIPYFYEEQNIVEEAKRVKPASICAFCSRMKRGRLYATLKRENYNVLALGQHLDDIAESFLMGSFYNGFLQTMKVNYPVEHENFSLRVIRPLCYIRETATRNFAVKNNLPVIPENCPACFGDPKERFRIKQLLAQQEVLFPRIFDNILAAIKPLMAKKANSDDIVMKI